MNKYLMASFPLMMAILSTTASADRPNIVLVMSDDQGWAQTSYYGHPMLKTPNLDDMAASGLRMDRFYAAPMCSQTRATIMTGRTNDRTGVFYVGDALNKQEKSLASSFRDAGYKTAHFGKWHLNRPDSNQHPLPLSDPHNPGEFGFEYWLSHSTFNFDLDPEFSRMGERTQFKGDSSEVLVEQALEYIEQMKDRGQPLFVVIWFSSPHRPYEAFDKDIAPFVGRMEMRSAKHHGEIVALDRAVGTLRQGLRDQAIEKNTLLWFSGDNGGLPMELGGRTAITPDSTGHLRGFKKDMYEGGIRVPAVIEWPGTIRPRISYFPAGTVDTFLTLIDVAGLKPNSINPVNDGISIMPVFFEEPDRREKPMGFRLGDGLAWIDNDWKLVRNYVDAEEDFQLYNLVGDPSEAQNLVADYPHVAKRMRKALELWEASVEKSIAGADYPEGKVLPNGRRPAGQRKDPLRRSQDKNKTGKSK